MTHLADSFTARAIFATLGIDVNAGRERLAL